ncbi:MAG TPA: Gfo/Idh/MocA family oxidoreductase [Phycisphaerae bacterium]|nr:Gfo/Idh/MocA family oxidoreductase [Phycisphaerae bacterium]
MAIPQTNRRQFLQGAAAGVAATAMANRVSRAAETGRPAKFVIGLMGAGGRGQWLLNEELVKRPHVRIAYVCDADLNRANKAADAVAKTTGRRPAAVQDYRKVLDDKDVHALFSITPDHWHALSTIHACQAGKDVYVEKPCAHNVWEGRKMVEAARKYSRVVQTGFQNRSAEYVKAAMEHVRSGELGDVHLVRVRQMRTRPSIGRTPDGPVPAGVDYDKWLGPAPERKFNPNHFHYNWHWHWEYSGGDIINDGVHQLDIARWVVGKEYPAGASGTGGIFFFKDDQETPDTQVVTWDFPGMTMAFELTLWTPYMKKVDWSIRDTGAFPDWGFYAARVDIFGTKNVMFLARHGSGWQVFDEHGKNVAGHTGKQAHAQHIDNFLACIESRATPNADIEEGHRSTILSHLGNISYRLGGRKLKFNGRTESIDGDEEANRMLKRVYREPYVVPEEV